MKRMMILFCLIIYSFGLPQAGASPVLKAAFLRDHQLWLLDNGKQSQLTKGRYIQDPKWSLDGRFISYLDSDKEEGHTNLSIYDTKRKNSYHPYVSIETSNFQWSPNTDELAYTDGGVLNITKTEDGRPKGFENVSLGTGDFSWFPDGKSFLVSSQPALLPTGWEPIRLFKVDKSANLDPHKMKPFYTIQTNSTDFFAIGAENFQWSADGRWVSFLAIPTASASMDANFLCVLSVEGKHFQILGNMLDNKDWVKWSPFENKLAYISGEGRFYVENKHTTLAEIPSAVRQKQYTPKGFVDLDLTWLSADTLIVARAKENKTWKEGPVPTMHTSLYAVNIISGKQEQITFPKKTNLDDSPQVVDSVITWLRRGANNDVWVKDRISDREHVLLKNVDDAPVFFNPE